MNALSVVDEIGCTRVRIPTGLMEASKLQPFNLRDNEHSLGRPDQLKALPSSNH